MTEYEIKRLCDRIKELVREKEGLKAQIADIKANCDLAIEGRDIKIMEFEQKLEQTEKDLADYQFNYPKIKELEQENAELKKEQKDANEKVVHLACNQNKDLKCKLTKAKKLLEKLLITSCNSDVLNLLPNCSEVLRVRVEAEQFLKEIEK